MVFSHEYEECFPAADKETHQRLAWMTMQAKSNVKNKWDYLVTLFGLAYSVGLHRDDNLVLLQNVMVYDNTTDSLWCHLLSTICAHAVSASSPDVPHKRAILFCRLLGNWRRDFADARPDTIPEWHRDWVEQWHLLMTAIVQFHANVLTPTQHSASLLRECVGIAQDIADTKDDIPTELRERAREWVVRFHVQEKLAWARLWTKINMFVQAGWVCERINEAHRDSECERFIQVGKEVSRITTSFDPDNDTRALRWLQTYFHPGEFPKKLTMSRIINQGIDAKEFHVFRLVQPETTH
jgi:hypothetical protein